LMLRAGARIGDIVAVTGEFGSESVALRTLLERKVHPEQLPHQLAKAVYRPNALLDLGLRLGATGVVTSSIDSSDGLAWSLHELSKMSHVGMRLASIPISKAAKKFAGKYGYSALDLGLYGGEEYQLVITVQRDQFRTAQKAVRGQLIPIGVVTKRTEGVHLARDGEDIKIEMKGWEHFRS